MRCDQPFGRLQVEVDVDEIVAEVDRLDPSWWRPHPEGHTGNDALPIVATNGSTDDDSVDGDMHPTPVLQLVPSLVPVLAAIDAPIGRTRMMRITPGGEATAHVDLNRYWWDRHRVHIPLRTDPSVEFHCGDASVHMPVGSAWVFDTWRRHNVVNRSSSERIHLVIDTVGSAALTALIDGGRPSRRVDATTSPTPRYERAEPAGPMAADALRATLTALLDDLDDRDAAPLLRAAARALVDRWPTDPSRDALASFVSEIETLGNARLRNGTELARAVRHLVVSPAWRDAHGRQVGLTVLDGGRQQPTPAAGSAGSRTPPSSQQEPRFDRPVFVVCPPRSGSTLLFELLATSPHAWTIGGESHALVEGLPSLHPAARGFDSNRLDETAAVPAVVERLRAAFGAAVVDRDGRPPNADAGRLRLVEKTPKNALRLPFIDTVFPDARYIHLVREPREEIASMIDAWASGRFVTYPQLPGWDGPPWSLVLTPGWRELCGRPLAEIAVRQWAAATTILLDDLERIDTDRVVLVRYTDLVDDPQATMTSVCEATGLPWDRQLQPGHLPTARHTLTPPDPDKWRRHWPDIRPLLGAHGEVRDAFDRVGALLDRGDARAVAPPRPRPPVVTPPPADPPSPSEPFHSVHTEAMPALLERAGITLLVSTYQSGRLIALRNDDGAVNTHFRFLPRPMGIAVGTDRLAVGTQREIIEYRNQPAVAAKIEPARSHDACYLPLRRHVTGDVSIHDMSYDANGDLWFVNTRFSCLATMDAEHSFVPRWKPRFISALAPEDRCHLNGLAMVSGSPAFVTAFGTTDEARGWRTGKADSGVVIDVASNEIVGGGLSMPHSPRWRDGRLWVLESGRGRVGVVDLATGHVDTVAELPGFTRGLTFVGRYALVGLSQVRESVFDGLPLTQRDEPRRCGVWIIDTSTGHTVGFLQFEGSVREVFDVQVLRARMPEIVELDDALLSGSFVVPDAN